MSAHEPVDAKSVPEDIGTSYPSPHDVPCRERSTRILGDLFGLTDFGVVLTLLPPGAWSAQRHWHSHEDEFIYVLAGAPTLVTEDGRTELRPGMCAGFKASLENGHHLVNDGSERAAILVVGTRNPDDACHYPDIDLHLKPLNAGGDFVHKDGTPCPPPE